MVRSCFLCLCLFGGVSILASQGTAQGEEPALPGSVQDGSGMTPGSRVEGVSTASPDAVLYMDFLESLVAGNFPKAEADLKRLRLTWPHSRYLSKAEALIKDHGRRRDSSGIVPFYIGNLVTGTLLSALIPANIIGVNISNQAINGGLYLAGAATGLGTAWLMSAGGDFPLAQEIWIESISAASASTWYFLYDAWLPPVRVTGVSFDPAVPLSARDRVQSLGLATALVLGRGITWATLRDTRPELGRAAFASQASVWTLFYSFVLLQGILEVRDQKVLTTTLVGAADSALALGALGWDRLGWSAYRSGLVSVGGIAGLLFAAGINMIAVGIEPSLDGRFASAVMGAGSLLGQAVATGLTGGIGARPPKAARLELGAYPSIAQGILRIGAIGKLCLN